MFHLNKLTRAAGTDGDAVPTCFSCLMRAAHGDAKLTRLCGFLKLSEPSMANNSSLIRLIHQLFTPFDSVSSYFGL